MCSEKGVLVSTESSRTQARGLKLLLADIIAERLKGSGHSGSWERLRKVPGVRHIEVTHETETLTTRIRVETDHQGTRWYTVSLKEDM